MTTLPDVRQRHITLMQLTCQTIGNVIRPISQQAATTLRDGPNGWTVLEVVCHLRDFDEIFYERGQLALTEDNPTFPSYNQEALAVERNYNSQNLLAAYEALQSSRQRLVAFFQGLNDEQWERAGIHPRYGQFTMTNLVMHPSHHDGIHLEQLTRIVASQNS